ncbi:MAG: PepSY domain-containing protein [Peptoniphilus harei]|uniref:Putative lipoprotein n=1 Tax=Peptoniphilus harei ACS-146-V-Sch2b TaxID=908338 RepID=E4L0E2_9FIRM|nr:PepSY domain-containing protein [Peptoniphilus harei]EFR32356.1 putative lipoprotein [Peptoniphilus harei ACS-146-V-Sch2b]MDK7754320.1 PepSY domain-containing protein [Peptoniphilus harei]MDK7760126.1 PepSY domain-containing protein [Peptoniphilus harei]MDK8271657.1 PepSY domain-containing protein [Peptoniphilus harei]MDK8339775.1 PepSY domain-containing protein [Peptoniphilus harei]
MNKKILMTTLGLGLALTLTACGPKNEKADNPNAKNNAAVEANANKNANKKAADAQTKEETAINKGAVANLDRGIAFDGFKKLHADAKVESFQLEVENGKAYYKVSGYDAEKEYEVTVDAVTGDIVKDEFEAENTSAKTADVQLEMIEAVDKYMDEALKDAGQGFEAGEYEVEFEDGKYVVTVEVVNGTKDISYTYDYETGKLIEKDM